MGRMIDADALEKEGWSLCRTFQKDKATMVYEVKKPSDFPTIEPERKKGKWIIHETENSRYDDMICPFCRKLYTVDAYRIDDIGFTAEDFNFCPNCGADMREQP